MPQDPARRRLVVIALAALAVLAGAGGVVVGATHEGSGHPDGPTAGSSAGARQQVSFLERIVPPPARSDGRPARRRPPRSPEELARRLPLERKVAQLFLFGFRGTDATAEIVRPLKRLDLGGVVLAEANYADSTQLDALTGALRGAARAARHVPPWVLAIQEGGDLNSFGDLPPTSAPADLANVRDARRQAGDTARALRPLGVTGVLGPVGDVGLGAGSALGARVYSDQAEEVASYVEASVRAFRRGHLFSSVSHFPGQGSADQSTEEGPASVGLGLSELRDRDLLPFVAAINAGVPGVTLSSALFPVSGFTVPASLSRAVATDLLRKDLHFEGVALTDDLADPAITALTPVPKAAVAAVGAGADQLYVSGPAASQRAAYAAVLRAARRGRITRARLDEAVARSLRAKRDYDLLRLPGRR